MTTDVATVTIGMISSTVGSNADLVRQPWLLSGLQSLHLTLKLLLQLQDARITFIDLLGLFIV